MRGKLLFLLTICLAAAFTCCTSDPEGPIAERFLEDGSYGVRAGETIVDTVEVSCSSISVPTGVGGYELLMIGEMKDIRFEAILLKFDFSDSVSFGRTISSATLNLPVKSAQWEDTIPSGGDSLFSMKVVFHELIDDFDESDSITVVPDYFYDPIGDSLGDPHAERVLSITSQDFSIDTTVAGGWLNGSRVHHGIAVVWAEEPDQPGLLEMYSHEFALDPPAIMVEFTDTTAICTAVEDYSVATFKIGGLDCVGGIATRIFFEFDLGSIRDRAMILGSFLVLNVVGEEGLGATPGEKSMEGFGLSSDFVYYLYTPDVDDPFLPAFLEGTGVDRGNFNPSVEKAIRMSLRGFVPDVLRGSRDNTGLVLQSDIEGLRVQRASFYTGDADSSLRPYIEVIYSQPAGFGD